MTNVNVFFHILTDERGGTGFIEEALKIRNINSTFSHDTIETLNITKNDIHIVVVYSRSAKLEWLNDLKTIKLEYSEVPVFLFCPKIELMDSVHESLRKKGIFLCKNLNALQKQTEEWLDHANAKKKKILLVDDDKNTLNSYTRILRKTPWELVTASSGKAALDILEKISVQLVITDIKMPEMHGIELVSKIKAHNTDLPIVVCSGYHRMKSDQNLQLLGVTDFVTKPVEPDVLKNKIAEIMSAQ